MEPELEVATEEIKPAEVTASAETETKTETQPATEVKTETIQELYELPDGRKVDAATLSKEWKENFMPEFTKKSQALAVQNELKKETDKPKWTDPEWQPQTYDELLTAAEQRVLNRLEAEKQAEIDRKNQANSWVESQMSEIKQADPNVSEELLFQHANKYGFADLKLAHQNMKDFNIAVKTTEKKVVQNMKSREEPVAAAPNSGNSVDGIDYFSEDRESAVEMLRRLKS